jgi:hypothetical protein
LGTDITPKEFANAFSVVWSTTKNPGLETQPWAAICQRLRRSEFLRAR